MGLITNCKSELSMSCTCQKNLWDGKGETRPVYTHRQRAATGRSYLSPPATARVLQQDAEGVRPGAQVPVEEAPAGHGQLHPGHARGHLRAEHSVRRPGPDPARPRCGGAEARAGDRKNVV